MTLGRGGRIEIKEIRAGKRKSYSEAISLGSEKLIKLLERKQDMVSAISMRMITIQGAENVEIEGNLFLGETTSLDHTGKFLSLWISFFFFT